MSLVNKRHIVSNKACRNDTNQLDQNERKKNKNTDNQAIINFALVLKKVNILLFLFIMKLVCGKNKTSYFAFSKKSLNHNKTSIKINICFRGIEQG